MVYQWHGRAYKVDANIVGAEVERIEAENGVVSPMDLVEAARPAGSALHPLFIWDDREAAELFRRSTATQILCHLSVKCPDGQDKTECRAYFNIADGADDSVRRKGAFVNAQDAFANEESRQLILRCAIRELKELKKKYSRLKELAKIFEQIDEL